MTLVRPIASFVLTTPAALSPLSTYRIDSKIGELFRESRYMESDRGKELRLVGLKKEGSPLVTQTKEKDVVVTRKKGLRVK